MTTPLQSLAANLWVADQPLRFLGLSVGTRMTILRLANGELAVISPIALTPTLIEAINALGPVAYQIAPNRYHHLFAAPFKQHYPGARFLAAQGLQEKRPELAIDEVLIREHGNIGGDLDYQQFRGLNVPGTGITTLAKADPINEVVFYHRPSRTLIITDIAFHFGPDSAWEMRLISRLIGGYQTLQPTYLERWASPDRPRIERSIRGVLAWDFDRVVLAHGSILETGGKAMLQAGYEWFLGKSLGD